LIHVSTMGAGEAAKEGSPVPLNRSSRNGVDAGNLEPVISKPQPRPVTSSASPPISHGLVRRVKKHDIRSRCNDQW
jgi:hypothetical protein